MNKIKYIILLPVFILISKGLFAQQIGDLKGIYYQAVAVDDEGKEIIGMDIEGKPLYNKTIGVRFTITKGMDGDILYQETQTALTDAYGLFTLIIGEGTQTGDSQYTHLLDMPWIDADQWLKVEIAIHNDGNYKQVSNQPFMTVPYSFYTDDIADEAITTAKILNGTILNEDIADGTIDLTTKVTNILPVNNGGTGLDASGVQDGQLLIGNGTTGAFELSNLTAGDGIIITDSAGSITIESPPVAIGSDGIFSVNINTTLGPNEAWFSPDNLQIDPIPNKPFEMGDIFLASCNVDLQGCILSVSMKDIVGGKAKLEVIIFNPGNNPQTPTFTSANLKFLLVK